MKSTINKPSEGPLPRGRHGLSEESVKGSQRRRLMSAMLELTGRRGYEKTSVSDVVAAARVSRNTFYESFQDKEDCYLAMCIEESEKLVEALSAGLVGFNWLDAVNRGFDIFLGWWQERPGNGYSFFVEMPHASKDLATIREKTHRPFEYMFKGLGDFARFEYRQLPPLRPEIPRFIVYVVTEAIADEFRKKKKPKLANLKPDLVHLTVRLLANEDMANQALAALSKNA